MPAGAPGALILAAGRGRRFGSDKRRARLPDGRPLLRATVARYLDVFEAVAVVLRADDDAEALLGSLQLRVDIVRVADSEGLGDSLAAGIGGCRSWRGVFVALGDMPWPRLATLRALRETAELTPEAVLRPVHEGRAGHPVHFPEACFHALARCRGDTGARSLTARARMVEVDDDGVVRDVDHLADMVDSAGEHTAKG